MFATGEEWNLWISKLKIFWSFLQDFERSPKDVRPGRRSKLPLDSLPRSPWDTPGTFIPSLQPSHAASVPGSGLPSPKLRAISSPFSPNSQESEPSPYERCSPRYHLSSSPNWYRRPITPKNPLYYLTPFPIQSSSAAPTPHFPLPEEVLEHSAARTPHIPLPEEILEHSAAPTPRLPSSEEVLEHPHRDTTLFLYWCQMPDEDGMTFEQRLEEGWIPLNMKISSDTGAPRKEPAAQYTY